MVHFGFLDSPFYEEKIMSKTLLHTKIKKVGNFLYGVYIDLAELSAYRKLTKDYNNMIIDTQQDISNFEVLSYNFQIILSPEVLEHIINPETAFTNLKKIRSISNGCKLVLTVPNAFSVQRLFSAIKGTKTVHPDHYFYFSPRIQKILNNYGFLRDSLSLYSSSNLLDSLRLPKHGVIAVCDV